MAQFLKSFSASKFPADPVPHSSQREGCVENKALAVGGSLEEKLLSLDVHNQRMLSFAVGHKNQLLRRRLDEMSEGFSG